MIRAFRIVLIALCMLVLGGTSAHAAVVVEFVPASAAPGERVQMNVIGLQAGDEVIFYLAPSQRVADALTGQDPPKSRFVIPLRRHSVERDGGIAINFTVPRIAPGRHVLVVHCKNCGGDGSIFSAVGDLKVAPESALPVTGREHGLILGMGVALLVLGAMMILNPRELMRG